MCVCVCRRIFGTSSKNCFRACVCREGFFEEPEAFYLVTELMDGGELFDRIVTKEFFGESEARALVRTLTDTLAHLHAAGVAYRDLKVRGGWVVGSWVRMGDRAGVVDAVRSSSQHPSHPPPRTSSSNHCRTR